MTTFMNQLTTDIAQAVAATPLPNDGVSLHVDEPSLQPDAHTEGLVQDAYAEIAELMHELAERMERLKELGHAHEAATQLLLSV